MDRKQRAATQTGFYLLIVAAILVVANLISMKAFKRFDLTETERFTLSGGSGRLVREGLKQPMTIEVYATRGLAKNEAFIQDLTDLLKEYERASQGKLTFSIIEPKTEEEKEAARKANLQEVTFGEGSQTGKDQATFAKGFMGMVFKYGSEQDEIPYWPPEETQGLEFFITNKIRELRDRADKLEIKIGVVTGKDELKISDNVLAPGGQQYNFKALFEQYLPFYKFEDVDLQNGDAEINQELRGLIITQPQKEYTEKELRRIDQFLMLGDKSLVVMASAVNLKASDATMKATLNTWGLEKLLEGYGIEMKKDAVYDWGRSFGIPAQTQTGQQIWFRIPSIIQVMPDDRFEGDKLLLDKSFAPFFRLDQVGFHFPSTLVAHPEKITEAKMKVVARTTPRATIDTAETIDMKISTEWKEKGEQGQRSIAVTIEPACCDGSNKCADTDTCKKGIVPSAFAGKGDNQGIEAAAQSKGNTRILVISSSQFLANPFARSGNPPPMPPQMAMMGAMGGDKDLQMLARSYYDAFFPWAVMSFKNTLDWMGGDADLVATSAKLLGPSNLTYSDVNKPAEADTDNPEELKKRLDEYQSERERLQSKVQWSLTFLPAALFAIFGIIRWRRREASRDSVG